MKEKVSEAQDQDFYRLGSLALVAVVFITMLVVFAWLMQKPIDQQARNSIVVGEDRVTGAEAVNK